MPTLKLPARRVLQLLSCFVLLSACAEDLRDRTPAADTGVPLPPPPPGPDGSVPPPSGPSHLSTEEEAVGTFVTRVDATGDALFVYLDLDDGAEVFPEDPTGDTAWDLAFSRFHIRANGGVNGAGGVEGTWLEGVAFGTTADAPSTGWIEDAADSDDEGEDEDTVFNSNDGWYSYNPMTHVLTPRDRVYFVRSTAGDYFEIQLTGYYDAAGTSGFPSFRWRSIAAPSGATPPPPAPPPPSGSFELDASSTTDWVYLRVGTDSAVSVADPTTSTGWDIAFSGTLVRTNGGTSGPGVGAAREALGDWESITTAETFDWSLDAITPIAGPPGSPETSQSAVLSSWYRYDAATHTVTARDAVFLVRTASGAYAKLRIEDYADGLYTIRLAPVARAVTLQTVEIDASSDTDFVYLSFRAGSRVDIADAATDGSWDLGLRRTNLRTNGGTSGRGMGGAIEAASADLGTITEAPTGGFVTDALVPLPGPPGSGEISANTVLGGWFDYDPATHAVSPGDRAYVLRTADGGFVKLRVVEWADGVYRIVWAYAGAARTDFRSGE